MESYRPISLLNHDVKIFTTILTKRLNFLLINKYVTLDAEKAFDRLETSYLQSLLKSMNFGPHFLCALKTSYEKPTAQICVNRFRSDDFHLKEVPFRVVHCPWFCLSFPLNLWLQL